MDYGTFFFTNIVSVTVYALCVGLLAWYNRNVSGMKWFAASLSAVWVKLVLQGLEGKVPALFSGMVANELYLTAFVMQMVGLHWFVVRKPFRRRWPFISLGLLTLVYSAMFLAKIPYSGNLINIPSILVCAASGLMLFRHGTRPVSRVAAFLLATEVLVMSYRAVLTNLRYMRPWEMVSAHTDPRWIYSLAAMALLTTCMVMCYLWYLVSELSRVLAEQARTDSLTGALNRRADRRIGRARDRAQHPARASAFHDRAGHRPLQTTQRHARARCRRLRAAGTRDRGEDHAAHQ